VTTRAVRRLRVRVGSDETDNLCTMCGQDLKKNTWYWCNDTPGAPCGAQNLLAVPTECLDLKEETEWQDDIARVAR
jgi:ferredoxin